MNDLTKHLLSKYFPYLVCFIFGVLVAWQGCGSGESNVTEIIKKPVPKIEYVDRWKTDTVRFVSRQVVTITDTITLEKVVNRLDTLLLIDTVSIVEAWLTEVTKYDTTALDGQLRLRWHNYQNFTENLRIDYTPNKVPLNWALGVHANAGLISDFNTQYRPLFGLGLQATIKTNYIGLDYGFNGQHYVGIRYGRNLINR